MLEAIAKMSAGETIVTHCDFSSNTYETAGKIMVSYYDVRSNKHKECCENKSNSHKKGW